MSREMSAGEAIKEARRCLHCARPMCRTGCPIENNIPEFNQALGQGNIGAAYEIISERSNLPAICSRVCPHEKQCESHCILAKKNNGIEIGSLEMFIADFAQDNDIKPLKSSKKTAGKVAVIGSGPAGLTVAGDLARKDFDVTIFEAQPQAGGVLMFGIPEFRLPKRVVTREINALIHLGVEIRCNTWAGIDFTVDDLFAQGFDAIFMGTGTNLPRILDIPGKDLINVVTASYFLQGAILEEKGQLNSNVDLLPPDANVVVVGAGNVAMDAARTAIRKGAKSVKVVYRKTEAEVAAFPNEFTAAVAEGVEFCFLNNPAGYLSRAEMNEHGLANYPDAADNAKVLGGLRVEINTKTDAGEFIATGDFKVIPCDSVILAIGQKPAARIVSTTKGIDIDKKGFVITRQRPYGMTTRAGVFSSGDVVHGPATVVLAMRESKKVAQGIAEYISAKKLLQDCDIL